MKPKKAPSAYEFYGNFQQDEVELGYVSFDVGAGVLEVLSLFRFPLTPSRGWGLEVALYLFTPGAKLLHEILLSHYS